MHPKSIHSITQIQNPKSIPSSISSLIHTNPGSINDKHLTPPFLNSFNMVRWICYRRCICTNFLHRFTSPSYFSPRRRIRSSPPYLPLSQILIFMAPLMRLIQKKGQWGRFLHKSILFDSQYILFLVLLYLGFWFPLVSFLDARLIEF